MSSPEVSIRPGLVLADLVAGTWLRQAVVVAGYTLAIALAAQLVLPLPFTPVPVTGQTFAVLLGAAALGPGRALAGAVLYLGLGVAGVPWFAASGAATVGYLVGFAAAGWLVGRWARSGLDRSRGGTAVLMVGGNVAIYACGVAGLLAVTGAGPLEALALGVAPFLVGDVVKIAFAVALLPATWRVVARVSDG